MRKVNIITRLINNARIFLNHKPLLRVRRTKDGFYQVQIWDYDSMDDNKVWGKCWNVIYIRKEYASELSMQNNQFAIFESQEEAIRVKEYFKKHIDHIHLSPSCSNLCRSGV